jgi:hypothetical protein
MLPFSYIAIGLGIHLVFDWIFQPREMAQNKSTDWKVLLCHTAIVGSGTFLFFCIIAALGSFQPLFLALVYMVVHALQDRYIWTWYNRKALLTGVDPLNDNTFFAIIGIDQTLHLLLLFYLATWLV